jgi:poly(A) polymerase
VFVFRKPDSIEYLAAEGIVRRLREAGHQALLAGGCVRDMLLGLEPKDYDVATAATPDQVAALFPDTRTVGSAFGVTLVVIEGKSYEVATFRTEGPYSDGRRPDRVAFSTIESDAKRRDFTINGMYWDPLSGEVVDLVGGRNDLEDRLLRTIGDPAERFREDHLRLIRAVRFAARFGLTIESDTRRAVVEHAHLVGRVAVERIQQELRIILTDRSPALALRLMDELGLLVHIFPELEDARDCEQPENYHPEGDVFVHTILTVEKLGPHPDFVLAMAALLHDIGKPEASRRSEPKRFPEHERIGAEMAEQICRRLRLPNAEMESICWLVKRHMYFHNAAQMKKSTLKRLFAEPNFERLCQLIKADTLASWGNLDEYHYILERRRELAQEGINPPPLLTGTDLIRAGYKPGPAFGQVLAEVRERQLMGEIRGREEALSLAERLAEKIGLKRC